MKQTNAFKVIEYLSIILVLSFFIYKNIYFVIIGICFSIYSLNRVSINKLIKNIFIIIELEHNNKLDDVLCIESKDLNYEQRETDLNLVERIEELGFIPSNGKR